MLELVSGRYLKQPSMVPSRWLASFPHLPRTPGVTQDMGHPAIWQLTRSISYCSRHHAAYGSDLRMSYAACLVVAALAKLAPWVFACSNAGHVMYKSSQQQ